jgi:polyisoprenoid-binding protein YceI
MKRIVKLAAALAIFGAGSAMAANFAVDPVHSSVVFRIKHNNVANFYGRINAPEGTIEYDAAKPEATVFNFTLKTANIDTANAQRDTHLKSPSYFNAAEYPAMTFKSTSVKKGEGDTLDVTGDLTFRGVKKSITVKLEKTGEATAQGRALVGFETRFSIKRSDYGMTEGGTGLGDEVVIVFAVEAGAR